MTYSTLKQLLEHPPRHITQEQEFSIYDLIKESKIQFYFDVASDFDEFNSEEDVMNCLRKEWPSIDEKELEKRFLLIKKIFLYFNEKGEGFSNFDEKEYFEESDKFRALLHINKLLYKRTYEEEPPRTLCPKAKRKIINRFVSDWKKGTRHRWSLVMATKLKKLNVPQAEAEEIVCAIATAAHDEEWKDRLRCVRDVYKYKPDPSKNFFDILMEDDYNEF